jgi:hypothetical protein
VHPVVSSSLAADCTITYLAEQESSTVALAGTGALATSLALATNPLPIYYEKANRKFKWEKANQFTSGSPLYLDTPRVSNRTGTYVLKLITEHVELKSNFKNDYSRVTVIFRECW